MHRNALPGGHGYLAGARPLDLEREVKARSPIPSAEPVEVRPRDPDRLRETVSRHSRPVQPPGQNALALPGPAAPTWGVAHWDYFAEDASRPQTWDAPCQSRCSRTLMPEP